MSVHAFCYLILVLRAWMRFQVVLGAVNILDSVLNCHLNYHRDADSMPPKPVTIDENEAFDPAALGLREISNLASWTVSSSKPGCGVDALKDDDTSLFWQQVIQIARRHAD